MRNFRHILLIGHTQDVNPKEGDLDVGTWAEANNVYGAIDLILRTERPWHMNRSGVDTTTWFEFDELEPTIEVTKSEGGWDVEVDSHGLGYANMFIEDITDLIDYEAGIVRGSAHKQEEREAMH